MPVAKFCSDEAAGDHIPQSHSGADGGIVDLKGSGPCK